MVTLAGVDSSVPTPCSVAVHWYSPACCWPGWDKSREPLESRRRPSEGRESRRPSLGDGGVSIFMVGQYFLVFFFFYFSKWWLYLDIESASLVMFSKCLEPFSDWWRCVPFSIVFLGLPPDCLVESRAGSPGGRESGGGRRGRRAGRTGGTGRCRDLPEERL